MRFIVSIILSAILAAFLGVAAPPSSASIAMEASMTQVAHGAVAVAVDAPAPGCQDAGCPAEHHDAACATQATHCKVSADRSGAAGVEPARLGASIRYAVSDDAGVGIHPELQLPPPRA